MIGFRLRVNDDSEEFERRASRGADRSLKSLSEAIVNDIRTSWSPSSPSAWGSPPAMVTGKLDESIEAKQGRDSFGRFDSAWIISAGNADAPYAGYLEPPGWLNRPFLEAAIDRAMGYANIHFEDMFDEF